jgi:hypothetical protein
MGKLRKHNKDGMKSKKTEGGIEKVGRGRGRWITGSRNVEECRKRWRRLDIA